MKKPKTFNEVDKLLTNLDRSLRGKMTTPAHIWRKHLLLRGVTPLMFNRQLERWIKRIHQEGTDKSHGTDRSNLVRRMVVPNMTWRLMLRLFDIMEVKKINIVVTVQWPDDQITRSSTTLGGADATPQSNDEESDTE